MHEWSRSNFPFGWMTLREVSAYSDYSLFQLKSRIHKGEIDASLIGGTYRISCDEFESKLRRKLLDHTINLKDAIQNESPMTPKEYDDRRNT